MTIIGTSTESTRPPYCGSLATILGAPSASVISSSAHATRTSAASGDVASAAMPSSTWGRSILKRRGAAPATSEMSCTTPSMRPASPALTAPSSTPNIFPSTCAIDATTAFALRTSSFPLFASLASAALRSSVASAESAAPCTAGWAKLSSAATSMPVSGPPCCAHASGSTSAGAMCATIVIAASCAAGSPAVHAPEMNCASSGQLPST